MSLKEIEKLAVEQLKDNGFTEKEVEEILEMYPVTEENLYGKLVPIDENESILTPLRTPGNGEIRVNNYTITKSFVKSLGFGIKSGSGVIGWGLSKTKWATTITAAVGWGAVAVGAVVIAAGTCASMYLTGYTGVRIRVEHRYAYDPYEGFGKWYMTDITPKRY